jgi:hypothetical protein
MTLTQQGATIQGSYVAADAGAFGPFTCQVSGTHTNGTLTLDISDCTTLRYGLHAQCGGMLRRSSGRLNAAVGADSMNGPWQFSVASFDRGGLPQATIDWRTTLNAVR